MTLGVTREHIQVAQLPLHEQYPGEFSPRHYDACHYFSLIGVSNQVRRQVFPTLV
jgi:hypothetical protein